MNTDMKLIGTFFADLYPSPRNPIPGYFLFQWSPCLANPESSTLLFRANSNSRLSNSGTVPSPALRSISYKRLNLAYFQNTKNGHFWSRIYALAHPVIG